MFCPSASPSAAKVAELLDSGIDATHPAFRRRDPKNKLFPKPFETPRGGKGRVLNRTRIAATYDFTRIRAYLDQRFTADTQVQQRQLVDAWLAGIRQRAEVTYEV